MEKKFRITVEGKQYIVAVEDISTDDSQNLYPTPGSMNVAAAIATPVAPATPAAISAPAAPAAAGAGDEVAPLGGVVQEIHVSVGQVVNEGDKLVSLEAMKMVTPVMAKRGGTVSSIAVKAGDPVDAGQVLLTIG
ncbi:putative biotin carboxyl carrier protein [Candidatus Competibacter denitrificans Run_A_D11]|uniref:Biotin carboxyl carrier protein n=1 Tax=Candidatus Competibacter denitrificans Run_A_D11 TaxID=1400863 RepID=W6MEE3_9GAMM|nr:biotin/lipoyl-containing protein [Candidatus Competibacter denitrificans]CDI04463.1 putative biotin carboxyl carrier protein [Candidatus Competibacter denitrificans Run_A_D11]